MQTRTVKKKVDRLGEIKAQIATLQDEYQMLVDQLEGDGFTEAEGTLFKLKVTTYERTTIDYKGLLAKLNVRQALINKFKRSATVRRVSVSHR